MISHNNTLSLNAKEREFLYTVADEIFPSKISVEGYNRLIGDAIERNAQEATAEAILLNAILESKKIFGTALPNLLATQNEVESAQKACYAGA